jgi:hypothetical protein
MLKDHRIESETYKIYEDSGGVFNVQMCKINRYKH